MKPVFQENEKSSGFENMTLNMTGSVLPGMWKKSLIIPKLKEIKTEWIFFNFFFTFHIQWKWSLCGWLLAFMVVLLGWLIFYIVSINKVITHCVYILFNRLVSNDFKNQWSIYHCLWVLYLMLLRIVHNNEFILRGQQKILRSGTI